MRSSVIVGPCVAALLACACSSRPEPKYGHTPDDGVPANSASEERLKHADEPTTTSASADARDPTQPYTTPVGQEASRGNAQEAAPPGGKGGKPTKPGAKDGKEKVSRAECAQTLDKYMDLALGGDSRLEGVPPEMVPQLKQQALAQARGEKGDPCATEAVTRSQYSCAMAATSTAAWQRCMGK